MFDEYIAKILKECGMTDSGVLGNSGGEHGGALSSSDFYASGDNRIPKVISPMISRRGKVKKKRKHKNK